MKQTWNKQSACAKLIIQNGNNLPIYIYIYITQCCMSQNIQKQHITVWLLLERYTKNILRKWSAFWTNVIFSSYYTNILVWIQIVFLHKSIIISISINNHFISNASRRKWSDYLHIGRYICLSIGPTWWHRLFADLKSINELKFFQTTRKKERKKESEMRLVGKRKWKTKNIVIQRKAEWLSER